MINFGLVPSGAVLPIIFDSFAGSTGASVTISGLAVTDIEVYKGTSVTQRSSDAGYALIDTDGIDIDGITGIHGFSIDTGDNTDSGFYAVGSFFTVVVSAITVDGQTVNFVAATFRMGTAEGVTGQPKVDVAAFGGAAGTFSSGRPEVNTTHLAGSAVDQSGGLINANVKQISGDATAADNAESFFDGTGYAGTNNVIPTVTTTTNLTNAPTAGDFTATMKTSIGTAVAASAVASVTGNVGGNVAGSVGSVTAGVSVTTNNDKTGYSLAAAYDFAKGTTAMTESYAANGAAFTPVQGLFAIHQMLMQFGVSATTLRVRKLDNATTAFDVTLDDAVNPTDAARV